MHVESHDGETEEERHSSKREPTDNAEELEGELEWRTRRKSRGAVGVSKWTEDMKTRG